MQKSYGGVFRTHASSLKEKAIFAFLHALSVATCLILAFGSFYQWPNPQRTQILALCAVLYGARHMVTLFVLLKRKVALSEGIGLSFFMAFFEIGFLLLGSGLFSSEPSPLDAMDLFAIGLILVGSFLNTGSELQRHIWKKDPRNKGRLYTHGLFSKSMHINYLGDSILFTDWAMLAACVFAFFIPLLITALFIFYHIPALDDYLKDHYGAQFDSYSKKTAKFIPYLY